MEDFIYDFIGIGIGPFNLGLAALAADINCLKCLFFEQKQTFGWHEGMMIKGATLQVPFYADLVTLAVPESRFSYLSFLKYNGKLFRFAIRENIYPTRLEYNQYCKWVADQLESLRFGYVVTNIVYNEEKDFYIVTTSDIRINKIKTFNCKRIVMGIGSVPSLPKGIENLGNDKIIHSSKYCFKKKELLKSKSICVIGSGQSAAEIFYDLLPYHSHFTEGLSWISRSERYFPMDYSKFSLEMTSPEYINYFYSLHPTVKDEVNISQKYLYKGINNSLIESIYDYLYLESLYEPIENIKLQCNTELKSIHNVSRQKLRLVFHHLQKDKSFKIKSNFAVLATGYNYSVPSFIRNINSRISFDEKGRYAVNKNYTIDKNGNAIFIQNAELHTHGFNTPDLGMGPYRNAVILNTILGYRYFSIEENSSFQTFELL